MFWAPKICPYRTGLVRCLAPEDAIVFGRGLLGLKTVCRGLRRPGCLSRYSCICLSCSALATGNKSQACCHQISSLFRALQYTIWSPSQAEKGSRWSQLWGSHVWHWCRQCLPYWSVIHQKMQKSKSNRKKLAVWLVEVMGQDEETNKVIKTRKCL